MKKRWIVLFLAVTLLLAIPAHAVTPRIVEFAPALSFDGTTANCSFKAIGNSMEDEISVTLKLWRGSTCLATWEDSGTGYLRMSETKTVTKGYTYKLTADVTINGTAQPQVTTSVRCS